MDNFSLEGEITEHKTLKIVLIVVIVLLVIAIFSVLGIYFAKSYKVKLVAEHKKENNTYANEIKNEIVQNLVEEETNTITSEQSEEEKTTESKLPVYSAEAKKKMKNIYKSNEKIAYLTFDDGPSQAVTPLILNLLKKENIKATFFLLGANVKANPELVKREYEEGHYLANHSYTHNYAKLYTSANNVLAEYNKTEKEIKKAIGNNSYSSHLFRFPGGYYGGRYAKVKKKAGKLLNDNNISFIDWNSLTGDAEGANTKEKIMSNIKKYTNGTGPVVILMHDAAAKILTYETLPDVIKYLKSKGYTFDNFYSIMQ